jgi:hypothetical protein
MGAVAAAAAVVVLIVAEFAGTYWISKRTGLYRWAQEQLGPPRRHTTFHIVLNRFGAVCFCLVLIGLPIQGAVLILAGIAAAIGVL